VVGRPQLGERERGAQRAMDGDGARVHPLGGERARDEPAMTVVTDT
jgi:hypothetical protein